MRNLANFQIINTPFFFLQKTRILFLKYRYLKPKKYIYYLRSRRKFLKLISKRFKLDYSLYKENLLLRTKSRSLKQKYIREFYQFTMHSGLKENNEVKKKFSYFNFSEPARVASLHYAAAKLHNNNLKNIWYNNKYFGLKKKNEINIKNKLNQKLIKIDKDLKKKEKNLYIYINILKYKSSKNKELRLNIKTKINTLKENINILKKKKKHIIRKKKIYNNSVKKKRKRSLYFRLKKIKLKINKTTFKFIKLNKFRFLGVINKLSNWFYIFNSYLPNTKFKYLHSYNYLTRIRFRKFRWFYYNKKRLQFKHHLFILKLKNKKKFLFFYQYLFYSHIFNKGNLIYNFYLKNFNFFFNTFEYKILTVYLDVTVKINLNNKAFPYYFQNKFKNSFEKIRSITNINKLTNMNDHHNNLVNNNKFFKTLFLFSFLNNKCIKINKINKIKKKKKNKIIWNFLFYYYYVLLIDFIFILLKYLNYNKINNNNNNKFYYLSYYFKLFWLLKKKNNNDF